MNDIVVGGMVAVAVLIIGFAARGTGRRSSERRQGDDASIGVMASDGGQCDGSSSGCGGGDGGGGD